MTKRQLEVLKFIEKYIKKNGYSPSIRDIQSGCNMSSSAQPIHILRNLREQKKINFLDNKARTIEII